MGPDGPVALRIVSAAASPTSRAELEVLATLDHPGLAGLVDFGRVESSGDRWVARTWIEGEDLGRWAGRRNPKELGQLLVRLCPALQELHERGFVHGDLKPENVLVDEAGRPHLTDFGLSRRSGQGGGTSGSLFYLAPEVLGGDAPGPAADLFALGVLLHALLVRPSVSAAEFYGRFPREDFFRATDTTEQQLPDWARGLASALLERLPHRRPSSALEVEGRLRALLGLEPPTRGEDPRRQPLRWSPLSGREAWLEELEPNTPRSCLLRFPAGEDPSEVARALRLWWALRDLPAQVLEPVDPELGLDADSRARLAEGEGATLLLPISAGDHEAWHRFDYLRRALQQARPEGRATPARLIAIADHHDPRGPMDPTVDAYRAPALEAATLGELLLGSGLSLPTPVVQELTTLSGGALTRARALVRRGLDAGDLIPGPEGLHLRPDADARTWAEVRSPLEETPSPDQAELLLLAAVEVADGEIELEHLRVLTELDATHFGDALTRWLAAGRLRWTGRPGSRSRLGAAAPLEDAVLDALPEDRIRGLFSRQAEKLEQEGADHLRTRLARFAARADGGSFADTLDALQDTGDAGRAERALEGAEQLERHARRFAPEHGTRAAVEVAMAWARLGQPEVAAARLDELEAGEGHSPTAAAALARARGFLAHERHEYQQALELLRRARKLDPEDGGEGLFREAMLAWDRRDEAAVETACAEAEGLAGARDGFLWSLRALRGLSRCRSGRFEEGLAELRGQLDEAVRGGDRQREAKARLNVASVLRSAGRAPQAVEQLERAVEIQGELGHLPGLAQAQAILGGALRRDGRLLEAAPHLQAALELRERLGDASGAVAVRGMLGLVHADGGHLRAALDGLEASARSLRAEKRSADAVLLEARATELSARLRSESRPPQEEPPADPHILLSHARGQALDGRIELARDWAERARKLAARLGQAGVEVHAAFLLEALGERGTVEEPDSGPRDRAWAERLAWSAATSPPDALQPGDVLRRATELGAAGYLDLAARVALRAMARADNPEMGDQALSLARNWLEQVELGLTADESVRARRTLLGIPDPDPREVDTYERALEEGGVLDMDVISLLDINQRLVSQEDLGSLLGEIVESALSVTRAERGFLVLEQGGEIEFDTARHSRRGDIVDPELEVSTSVLRQAFEEGTTLRLSDAGDDPLLSSAPSVENLELRSILVTPFAVDQELRGAIYVDHRLKVGAFSPRAERMLELLSGQAALAIRQVRRLDEIRDLNRELNQRVRSREKQLQEAHRALEEAGASVPAVDLVGSSAAMDAVRSMIDRAAPSHLPVLVSGASGTGKELAAKALHRLSARGDGPIVTENCAALPPSLIESELFGYKKGAFTGADRDRAGIFERADGGTLFLDEIGELPLELQAKLLRVLETGELRRVGDTSSIHTDFRLVAATNRDLGHEVAEGRFRADLMYRLDALRIEMPPLAARLEDVPELVQHFLRHEARNGDAPRGISRAVLAALGRREWPGNVRELANEISRLCVLSEGDLEDPELIRPPAPQAVESRSGHAFGGEEVVPFSVLERQAIEHALRITGGDKRQAAELLGISRAKLYQRLKAWAETEGTDG